MWVEEEIGEVAVIPYCSLITNRLTRLLRKRNIKTVSRPPMKLGQFMQPVTDSLGLGVSGIYRIPCACGLSYIGQTGRTIAICRNEHQKHLRLGEEEKCALDHHSWATGHSTLFEDTMILF